MLVLGQGLSDAHPYKLQMCTVASLSSPLRGPSVCSSFSRPQEVFTRKVTTQEGRRLSGNLSCCCCCSVAVFHIACAHDGDMNWHKPCAESPGSKLLATPAPLEHSNTHSCERSKARKTGAQLRRSAKNDARCAENTLHRTQLRKASCLCCELGYPPNQAMS